jgi:Family of unknown function (DUF6090)
MINFFRKIRKQMADDNKPVKYMRYAIGEIVLLVIGILIALSINNWNENRKEINTARILAKSLVADLNKDLQFLNDALSFSQQKITSCDSVLFLLSAPNNNWNSEAIYQELTIVGQSNPFFPTTGTYQQIVTSGLLKLFKQPIANQLNAYDLQLKKVSYWAAAEDQTLWLMADFVWKGMNMNSIVDIRFKSDKKHEMFMNIPDSSLIEFSNLIATVKTYRLKTEIEFKEQLIQAKILIQSLNSEYQLNNTEN